MINKLLILQYVPIIILVDYSNVSVNEEILTDFKDSNNIAIVLNGMVNIPSQNLH